METKCWSVWMENWPGEWCQSNLITVDSTTPWGGRVRQKQQKVLKTNRGINLSKFQSTPFTNRQIGSAWQMVASKIKHNLSNAMQRLTFRIIHQRDCVGQINVLFSIVLSNFKHNSYLRYMEYVWNYCRDPKDSHSVTKCDMCNTFLASRRDSGWYQGSIRRQAVLLEIHTICCLEIANYEIFRAHCRFVKLPTPTNQSAAQHMCCSLQ